MMKTNHLQLPKRISIRAVVGPIIGMLLLSACSTGKVGRSPIKDGISSHHPPPADMAAIPDAVPKDEPKSRYGNPESYEVFGKRYYPLPNARGYSARGIASWYGSKFHGQRTSSGESYDMYAMTAAHKTLPLPSYVRVTNLTNNRSVVVKVNDRGPFHDNRLIDLSYTAAWKLGIAAEGTGLVEVVRLDPNSETVPVKTKPVKLRKGNMLPELFLQVGAFGSSDNAQRLKKRLEEHLNTTVLIEDSEHPERPVYRVQVGPIASVELADHLSQQLDKLGIADPHVVIR
ncbi:MAG: septal ring lytic transglycosylase RlpA family protein [Candidatus Thiodiazotropha sp.]|jgi:rare lipoprotein A